MQDLAATAQHAAAPAQPTKSEKKPRISKRVRQAIDLLMSGKCELQKDAADRVNLSREHLCRELKKPHVRVFCAERARENLALGALRASNVMLELMECDANGVRFDASRFVLGVEGIKPAQDAQASGKTGTSAGFIIDLTEPGILRVAIRAGGIAGETSDAAG